MSLQHHVAGPSHAAAGLACERIVALCCRIRRDDRSSPLAHALARAVHEHAVLPFARSCSAGAADLSLIDSNHELAERNWLDLLPSLHRVITIATTCAESRTAARILSCLADEMRVLPRDIDASIILNAIWRDVFASFSGHLAQWLNFGTVHDASGEFFICRNVDFPATGQAGIPPGHTFRIAYDRLPTFVSREVADSIFFAGQVMNCILRFDVDCVANEPAREVSESIGIAVDPLPGRRWDERIPADQKNGSSCVEAAILEMRRNGANIGLSVEAASLVWRKAASSRMSRLMPHSSIDLYLHALREYFLLGNEQFWRSFFSQLHTMRNVLKADVGALDIDAAERCIEHIVDTALADSHCNSLVPCILRFDVETDGQLSPYFDVPFPASAVIASTSGKYSQVFSVAFGVRGVVHSLERCYRSITQALRPRPGCASRVCAKLCSMSDKQRIRIQQCALLRMRMSRFMQAFDDYLQVDVFETGFLSLLEHIGDVGDVNFTPAVPFDNIANAHAGVMNRWLLESFADMDAVQRRLHALFDACYGLCGYTESIIDGSTDSSLQGHRHEAAFDRNVELLVCMLSSLQGRIGGSKVGVLLMKVDWDSFYQDCRGGARRSRQIFAES